ncbi:MAG: response regulator transcription factor [Scytolyngbya sp. HA4215-MV1]|jgi:DNA-binding NarL/FixJ family response regulator|nr:response regulator transcription factor [Scytolyngbya sp. HA4215-MV1]
MSQNLSEQPRWKILVADGQEVFLRGTLSFLKTQYPQAEICTARTGEAVLTEIQRFQPDLVVLDVILPEKIGEPARSEAGIQLLKILMQKYPNLHLTVQSTCIKLLIRIRAEIDGHKGGFTAVDKSLSGQDLLTRINWALQGLTHTKDLGTDLEMKPEWLEVLRLAFVEELTNRAIAQRMQVSARTVQIYWTKIQEALEVYQEKGKDLKIQTENRARKIGLID